MLLQLIEREELSITEVSLGRVTEAYLAAVRSSKNIFPEELADFLVVAAKLIFIKSRALLPDLESEAEEGPPLEDQLRLYREFVEASRQVRKMLRARRIMFPRQKPLTPRLPRFAPPPKLIPLDLAKVMAAVIRALEPFFQLPKAAIARAVSLQEKMERIRQLILERATMKFQDVLADAKSKTEVIVNFLALLELVKQRVLEVRQEETFHDIVVHRKVNHMNYGA
ncbi:segregation/condensation protein A [Candidatus Uhrbacteria bacterium]|nr:segregation/condensation protein A [Candidatus Uhrbacteria bacterium]